MFRIVSALAVALLLVSGVGASGAGAMRQVPAVPAAADVVATAVRRAATEQKVVLIEFGASWCIWCRSFDAFVKAPDTALIVAANYVVTNLVVQERDDKTALEHAGGSNLMRTWGGEKAGLPFYVFLDRDGKKIADSNAMPGGTNIGFPAVPAEIDAFMGLIAKTAKRMTSAERGTLRSYLVRVMPKPPTAAN